MRVFTIYNIYRLKNVSKIKRICNNGIRANVLYLNNYIAILYHISTFHEDCSSVKTCLNACVNYSTCIKLCNILFPKTIIYMYLQENCNTFRTVLNVLLYLVSKSLIYVGSSCP